MRSNESRSFLPLMPLSRPAARHSLMLSRSYGGRVCGDVACFWPVLTRLLSVPCLGHKNRTRGAAQGPSKPRNRQMSQPCSHRAGPSLYLIFHCSFGHADLTALLYADQSMTYVAGCTVHKYLDWDPNMANSDVSAVAPVAALAVSVRRWPHRPQHLSSLFRA